MNEKENIFDIRSNIDPVDNKPYVEVLKEDKDYKARFAAKNKDEVPGVGVGSSEPETNAEKKAKGGEIVIGKGRDYIKDLL